MIEVWSMVEGAFDESHFVDESIAEEAARQLAEELVTAASFQGFSDWQVYVLPHSCADGEDCECVQWLTNHHPMFTSETYVPECV